MVLIQEMPGTCRPYICFTLLFSNYSYLKNSNSYLAEQCQTHIRYSYSPSSQ